MAQKKKTKSFFVSMFMDQNDLNYLFFVDVVLFHKHSS